MAGDWIKMRSDLFTHPKVVRITSALKADRLRTVGGLMSVWCLFDAHSIDGQLEGYTLETVDELIGWLGFAAAMKSVGWLDDDHEGLVLPEFDTHNGQSAKRRAQDSDRKRAERLSASDEDKNRTREEKRREEKSKPLKSKAETANASRLPADWMPSLDDAQFCAKERPDLSIDGTASRFKDYWVAQPGVKGRKLDWPATWRNWVRNEKAVSAKSGNGAWWLSDQTVLAKGLEFGIEPHRGESMPSFKGRVQAIINNGGKLPAPKPLSTVVVRSEEPLKTVTSPEVAAARSAALKASLNPNAGGHQS